MKNKDVKIEFTKYSIFVHSPFNRGFLGFARNSNGRWDGKCWGWGRNEHTEITIINAVKSIYGAYSIKYEDGKEEFHDKPIVEEHFVSRFELMDI